MEGNPSFNTGILKIFEKTNYSEVKFENNKHKVYV